MDLLILGGTLFLGRHLVDAARERGHRVTLFNRGRTRPHLFPEVEKLRGDRKGDLSALAGRRWDAVIDTSGYVPRAVVATAEALRGAVDRYVFISTISVYDGAAGIDEASPLREAGDPAAEEMTPETYGALKLACEKTLEQLLQERLLVVRPGILVGPCDPTGRFTYWVRRVRRGGEVLVPDCPHAEVQVLDARDLAAWIVRLVEQGRTGPYNAAGPREPLTLHGLLDICDEVGGRQARFARVDESFLIERGVQPFADLPLWLPDAARGFFRVDLGRALAEGLRHRPLEVTARDVLEGDEGEDALRDGRPAASAHLDPAREDEILRAWHERGVGHPAR